MKMLNTIKATTVIKKQKHRSEDQKTTTKTLPWVNANKDQVTKKLPSLNKKQMWTTTALSDSC